MISKDCGRLLTIARMKNDSASKGMLRTTKILLVEGFMDKITYIPMISSDVEIISAGDKSYFIRNGGRPLDNVKKAIADTTQEFTRKKKEEGLYGYIELYGVIDKDFENAYPESNNLFVTDTNDLETLLFSCEAFSFSTFPTVDKETQVSIDGLAYQLGSIRRAFFDFIKNKNDNIREYISEEQIRQNGNILFVKNKDLTLKALINVFKKDPTNFFAAGLGEELATPIIHSYLRSKGIMNGSNLFVNKVEGFDKTKVDDYWDNVKGHDVCEVAKHIIPSIDTYIPDIHDTYKKAFEKFIEAHTNREKLKTTNLYKRMHQAGVMA